MSSDGGLVQGSVVELEQNRLWAPGLGIGEERGSENDSSILTPRAGGERPVGAGTPIFLWGPTH